MKFNKFTGAIAVAATMFAATAHAQAPTTAEYYPFAEIMSMKMRANLGMFRQLLIASQETPSTTHAKAKRVARAMRMKSGEAGWLLVMGASMVGDWESVAGAPPSGKAGASGPTQVCTKISDAGV